jgi:CxxC-x17-CxxC domain-containing protein
MDFVDRILKCSDCSTDFVFTAGEQLFFFDKQFKNDPKRCKLCKAKRANLGKAVGANAAATLPLSRTETRTECSACGIETTVPFKPTQGRPVLCRQCFQLKRVPSAVAAVATMDSPAMQAAAAAEALVAATTGAVLHTPGEFVTAQPFAVALPPTPLATAELIAQIPPDALIEAPVKDLVAVELFDA